MVFSSTVFLFLFLPAVLVVYFICKNRMYRNMILLLASIGFYAWGEPIFVWVMLTAIAVNWIGVWFMDRAEGKNRKRICILLISGDVLMLFVYKYLSFVLDNIRTVFGKPESSFELALPIGISFFTFQMMSYVFDVYYGKCESFVLFMGWGKKFCWQIILVWCLDSISRKTSTIHMCRLL